jgi:natural product precursor
VGENVLPLLTALCNLIKPKTDLSMEKKKLQLKNSRLSLKKESIANLSKDDMGSLRGGEGGSTCHWITCSWCTSHQQSDGFTSTSVVGTCSFCTTLSVNVSLP